MVPSMIVDSPLALGLLSALAGFSAGYGAVRATAAFAAAVIFLAAVGKSDDRRRMLLGGLYLGLAKTLLFSALFYGAWRAVIWFDLFQLDSNGFICLVGVFAGLAAGGLGVPAMIERVCDMAWEAGFAEEPAVPPGRRRRAILDHRWLPRRFS